MNNTYSCSVLTNTRLSINVMTQHEVLQVLYTSLSIQLRQYLEDGEYGLDVDLHIALWLNSRAFPNKPHSERHVGLLWELRASGQVQ